MPPVWRRACVACGLMFAFFVLAAFPARCSAQFQRARPHPAYYAAVQELYSGEYQRALKEFQSELRGGMRTTQSRWFDSICYYTMLGETYYHLGQNAAALEQFNAASELYLSQPDWMMRVQFPRAIQSDRNLARQPTPWGRSSRGAVYGQFKRTYSIGTGRINNDRQVRQGGVVEQAMLLPFDVAEIVRCTALAIQRRGELLGPLAKHDKLTDRLIDELARRPGPPNHWSAAWIDVQLGVALAAAGKGDRAKQSLERALLVSGQLDHPLSCVAMTELGRLAMAEGDLQQAAKMFEEAVYSAYYFDNYGIIAEALRLGTATHLIANQEGVYPPLAAGIEWSRRERLRHLESLLLLLTVENQAATGQTEAAQNLLAQIRQILGRRELAGARLGAQANYLNALVDYQAGNMEPAGGAISDALAFQRDGSTWLFQIALADSRYLSGALTTRNALMVYEKLLADPAAADWSTRPLDALAVLAIPHSGSYELWFTAALQRKDVQKAVEISDAARRHRFYTSLPLGGRLLALRTILETAPDRLPKEAALQRQDLTVKYPAYEELSRRAQQIRRELAAEELLPEDDTQKEQLAKFSELGDLSVARERMLRAIALSREGAAMTFPAQMSTGDVQDRLAEGQALLSFFFARGKLHAFLLGSEQSKYAHWQISSPAALRKKVSEWLRELGNVDANRELKLDTLLDDNWQQASRDVWKRLFQGSKVDVSKEIDELVIVPDGLLWYLPFEALIPAGARDAEPLLSRVRIRYAPTVSLAVPDDAPLPQIATSGVVVGKLFPQDKDEVAVAALESLKPALSRSVALRSPLAVPAPVIGSVLDELIVLDDVAPTGAYDWSPIPVGRGRSATGLEEWMALPWGGPQRVVLPGFHTIAENGLRRNGRAAEENEVFLSVCGLMAGGARTVLMSRWRTGGQSSLALVSEFAQELPQSAPAAAWQRSTVLLQSRTVDWQQEPRVQRFDAEVPPLATHPFFWAGYMVIDSGADQPADEDDAKPDALADGN